MADLTTELRTPATFSLRRTLSLCSMGQQDPTFRLRPDSAQFVLLTACGPVTLEVVQRGTSLRVRSWGSGADWIAPQLPALLGLHDDPAAFQPSGKLQQLWRRHPGAHLPRWPVVFHRLTQIVLLQLVSWADGFRGWRQLVERFGTPAPGDLQLMAPPSAGRLRELGYYDLVGCGILPRQARLVCQLAKRASRIESLVEQPDQLVPYLLGIPGIGDWTAQYLRGSCLGEPDALLTGDYHMPHAVAWFFAAEPRGTDARMIELLEPYRGNRFRVVNLLWQSSSMAPRRGPRQRTNAWRFST